MGRGEAISKELRSAIGEVKRHLIYQRELGLSEVARPQGVFEKPLSTKRGSPPVLTLEQIEEMYKSCQRCGLAQGRTHIVFGVGDKNARLALVGEGPGHEEDIKGEPFVGRAGELLNRMLASINIKREEVYILNIVKCRPPSNRTPRPDEIEACSEILNKQLDVLKPKLVVALGAVAAQNLLKTTEKVSKLRGRWYPYRGAKLLVTYHPAYLLRNPKDKKLAWEDLKVLQKEYQGLK